MYRLSTSILTLTLARSATLVESFSIRSHSHHCSSIIRFRSSISRSSHNRYSGIISTFSTASSEDNAAADDDGGVLPEISSMRIRAIKDELNEMGISFTDCFDKDSLVDRLKDARSGAVSPSPKSGENDNNDDATSAAESKSTSKSASTFDREAVMDELRQKKVRELRTMCAQNNIKWASMIEKEELVRALADYKEQASEFSTSGALTPGKVTMINDDILGKEVSGGAATPLLLDVYATWCGPCKMMAPQLDEAAAELGDKVRVAKIDSDEYPDWAGRLQVKGLPTVIVFDGNGKEVERVEGALMKDQLVQLAQKHA